MANLKKHKAIALILGYSVIASLFILTVGLLTRTINELNHSKRDKLSTQAFYAAESALQVGAKLLMQRTANNDSDASLATFDSGWLPSIMENFSVRYSWQELASSDSKKAEKGVVTFKRLFKISATAKHDTYDVAKTVNYIISRNKTYTFQHAVFYADDLEILPGADMTLSGKIHSNQSIYLGATSGKTLTVDTDYLRSAGEIYNKRKDSTAAMPGTVSIKANGATFEPMKDAGDTTPLDCDRADWTSESQNRWDENVKSSIHGVQSQAAPTVSSIQPGGYYDNSANIRIVNNTIYAGATPLVEGSDIPAGTITTTTTFYNNREGKYVKMTVIDLKKLAGYASGDVTPSFPNRLPANGLLYATRDDVFASEQPGIELVNGATIYSKDRPIKEKNGLTVVSNNPIYIKGDFNVDSGTNKVPCAVITDSANILSNNWNDANSHTFDLTSRIATATEVNTAFIAGIKSTVGSAYSGGLENYPRFHEDWNGKTFKIRGSFVELWNSNIAQGNWIYGGKYYTAPIRNWNYDSDFNDENNLPPFTPFAVEANKISWWES